MAMKENVPKKLIVVNAPETNAEGSGAGQSPNPSVQHEFKDKESVVLYKSHAGNWGTDAKEVIEDFSWLPKDLLNVPDSSPAGTYFLISKIDGSYMWVNAESPIKVRCATSRGLYFIREELTSISAQLFTIVKFFDKSQAPPPKNDTELDSAFFSCRPGLRGLPRVLLLALHDALVELGQTKGKCTPVLNGLFDAAEFLSTKRKHKQKDRGDRIRPHVDREKRSVWDLVGPSEDF